MRNLNRESLDPEQIDFIGAIKSVKRCYIALPMSYGKTVISATAVEDLLNSWSVTQVLIVAPLRVAEHVWPAELEAWEHLSGSGFTVITGTAEARARAARSRVPFHIVNRENVPWLVKFWGDDWPYDALIYDEASRLKGGRKRTKPGKKLRKDGTIPAPQVSEFGALCKVQHKLEYVILLSGTPAPNGLLDIWGPVYLLDKGARLGSSKTAYRERWFKSDYNGWNYEPREGAFPEIMDRVKDVMLSAPCKRKEKPTYNPIYVDLSRGALREYNAFKRTLVDVPRDVEAKTAGVLANKLLQFANGSLYDETGTAKYIHDAKLDALESVIEEAAGESVLVAYNFKFDREAIVQRFKYVEVLGKDPTAVDRWNKGKIRLLLVHPASAGHGLNLQFGGHIAAWYGLTWNLELYQQLNKRLDRRGQEHQVFIHHILARGTIDERVFSLLPTKAELQDRVLQATIADFIKKAMRERGELTELEHDTIVADVQQNAIFGAIFDEIRK
jgi:SNF2 family DNA or RNA helicase